MIAIDTNLLVYAHRERTPQHKRARKAIERAAAAPRGWGMSAAVLPEFWSVVTHPSSEGRPSTPAQAAASVRALTDRAHSSGCPVRASASGCCRRRQPSR